MAASGFDYPEYNNKYIGQMDRHFSARIQESRGSDKKR